MEKIPHICTVDQLSKETGLPTHTIRTWLKSGELKHLRSGKKYLINFDVFLAFIGSGTQEETKINNA